MQGTGDELSGDAGSPGTFRRISATSDLLMEDMKDVRDRSSEQKKDPKTPLRTSSSLKISLENLTHEILRRAWSGPPTEKPGKL